MVRNYAFFVGHIAISHPNILKRAVSLKRKHKKFSMRLAYKLVPMWNLQGVFLIQITLMILYDVVTLRDKILSPQVIKKKKKTM